MLEQTAAAIMCILHFIWRWHVFEFMMIRNDSQKDLSETLVNRKYVWLIVWICLSSVWHVNTFCVSNEPSTLGLSKCTTHDQLLCVRQQQEPVVKLFPHSSSLELLGHFHRKVRHAVGHVHYSTNILCKYIMKVWFSWLKFNDCYNSLGGK